MSTKKELKKLIHGIVKEALNELMGSSTLNNKSSINNLNNSTFNNTDPNLDPNLPPVDTMTPMEKRKFDAQKEDRRKNELEAEKKKLDATTKEMQFREKEKRVKRDELRNTRKRIQQLRKPIK